MIRLRLSGRVVVIVIVRWFGPGVNRYDQTQHDVDKTPKLVTTCALYPLIF